MPARSYKVDINNTSGFSLTKTHEELLSGAYTDGWAPPPQVIQPGQSISILSESDGVLGGTEGDVIYNVLDFGGSPHGSFYIYWHAPYVGNSSYYLTQNRGLLVSENGNLEAGFGAGDPTDFRVSIAEMGTWNGVPNDGDGHSHMMYEVDGLLQGFQTPPPATYGAFIGNLTLATWPGTFAAEDSSVSIGISLGALGTTNAKVLVHDKGGAAVPPLDLEQTVDLTEPASTHRPPIASTRSGLASTLDSPKAIQMIARGHVPANQVKHPVQLAISVGPQVVLRLLSKVGEPVSSATRLALRYQRFNALNLVVRDVICPIKLAAPR